MNYEIEILLVEDNPNDLKPDINNLLK